MNVERYESLRKLTPAEAVQAWLDGDFGIDDESAMIEAIRKDSRVTLSDEEIIDVVGEAIDEGLDAEQCLARLERKS